jgi:uncharacterized protein
MLIDFASLPPTPELGRKPNKHMSNYDRIYESGLERTGVKSDTPPSIAEYMDIYDKAGIDHVVIRGKDSEATVGLKVENQAVSDFCRNNSPRFIGLAGIDPHKGMDAVRDLEFAVKELGLRGAVVSGFEARLQINDKRYYPIYAKCVELGIPVNIHSGMSFSSTSWMGYGRPIDLDEVLVHFPELVAIASVPGFPWVQELVGVAWRHKNLCIATNALRPKYLMTPHSGYEILLQYGRTILQDQIIFGSNWPILEVQRSMDEIRSSPLPENVQKKWLGENAARILKLDL